LRRLLATTSSLADAHTERMRPGAYVLAAAMPETDRLWHTITAWWTEIEVLIVTGVTKRQDRGREHRDQVHQTIRRGFRNEHHDRARILLTGAARRAAPTTAQRLTSR